LRSVREDHLSWVRVVPPTSSQEATESKSEPHNDTKETHPMNSQEALAYLKSVTADDPKAQEAVACLELLAKTADDLAKLHEDDLDEAAQGMLREHQRLTGR
jgi:hypothetical protein